MWGENRGWSVRDIKKNIYIKKMENKPNSLNLVVKGGVFRVPHAHATQIQQDKSVVVGVKSKETALSDARVGSIIVFHEPIMQEPSSQNVTSVGARDKMTADAC
ncbi:hypothetical protein CDAR_166711 [Caerostris darwini]|uniref:Uncharacterized protein n=1 Tax=Caerostris darwini TaxID=1538125 RepID=A0AAV4QLY7_9ARAC|nr:hypothetical protein CDAR_166711 [Caerostris darwini]